MKDYRMRYTDLRLALEWSFDVKESIKKLDEPHQGLKEASNYAYSYLKSYCDTIKLEEK